jgi:hypothetical protein
MRNWRDGGWVVSTISVKVFRNELAYVAAFSGANLKSVSVFYIINQTEAKTSTPLLVECVISQNEDIHPRLGAVDVDSQ